MVTHDEKKFASAVVAHAIFGDSPAVERMHRIYELALCGLVGALVGSSVGHAVRTRPSAPRWLSGTGLAIKLAGIGAVCYAFSLYQFRRDFLVHDHIRALDVIRRKGATEDHLTAVSAHLRVGPRAMYLLQGPRGAWVPPHEARAPRWYCPNDYISLPT